MGGPPFPWHAYPARMTDAIKSFEAYTREYVEASERTMAFVKGVEGYFTAEQSREFLELVDVEDTKREAWHRAFHDPTVR